MEYEPWWNILITVKGEGMRQAKKALQYYGKIEPSHYSDVLKLKVTNMNAFLDDFNVLYRSKSFLQDCISGVQPLMETFYFDTKENFEKKVKAILKKWLTRLNGKSFYVCLNCKGQEDLIHPASEEQYLDHYVINLLELQKGTAYENFDDPDYVIDIETLDRNAGISIWSREDLKSYPFIHTTSFNSRIAR